MLVVDTGVLVAAADLSDPAHEPCAALLASPAGPIVTTGLVIAEASYLISRELGAGPEALLFQAIAQGEFTSRILCSPIGYGSTSSSRTTGTCHSAAPTRA